MLRIVSFVSFGYRPHGGIKDDPENHPQDPPPGTSRYWKGKGKNAGMNLAANLDRDLPHSFPDAGWLRRVQPPQPTEISNYSRADVRLDRRVYSINNKELVAPHRFMWERFMGDL